MAMDPIVNRAQKHLRRDVWKAWEAYSLIENGDKVMKMKKGRNDRIVP